MKEICAKCGEVIPIYKDKIRLEIDTDLYHRTYRLCPECNDDFIDVCLKFFDERDGETK